MAQKRMFDKTITNDDNFLEMPTSSQVLYFHLSMNADDDGFLNNWKSIMRMTGTKDDDLKVLIAKQYIIPFDSGVIVIKHWRINNFLRKDRHIETKYQKELSQLEINDNQEYWLTNGQPRIDKNSIEKNSIDNNMPKNVVDENDLKNKFEELWKLYPNKKGKADAYKHFKKFVKEGIKIETMEDGIKRYNAYIEAEHIKPKYIKYGSSWFNQESWNDDYTITREPTTKDIAQKIDFMNFLKEE